MKAKHRPSTRRNPPNPMLNWFNAFDSTGRYLTVGGPDNWATIIQDAQHQRRNTEDSEHE